MKKIITYSSEKTQEFAQEFAKKLHEGDVVLLYGNLGAGKTTFTQGIAKEFGIEHRVISPTFIIMRSYEIENRNIQTIYHIDLYRTENKHDIESAGVIDVLGKPGTLTIIEWPEKMENLLPKKRWDIHIENIDQDEREIVIEKYE